MASTGVNVKALKSLPELQLVDEFYYTMFDLCPTSQSVMDYCKLHNMSKFEIVEAIQIISMISSGVS
jgi:hypothetical protein